MQPTDFVICENAYGLVTLVRIPTYATAYILPEGLTLLSHISGRNQSVFVAYHTARYVFPGRRVVFHDDIDQLTLSADARKWGSIGYLNGWDKE